MKLKTSLKTSRSSQYQPVVTLGRMDCFRVLPSLRAQKDEDARNGMELATPSCSQLDEAGLSVRSGCFCVAGL